MAERVVTKIAKLINPNIKNGDEVILETKQSSNQKNGFDCGVFTLANSENIAENEGEKLEFEKINQKFVSKFREDLIELIHQKYLEKK